jgi:uncharacterized paraquat-inducible protein A
MDASVRVQLQSYEGPSCPRCGAHLTTDWIRTGIVRCPDCSRDFESTAFDPPSRRLRVEPVAASGPVEANACANHARNAAVTSCGRCGLFICALCNMDVGTGPYCPSCFDRLRSENALQPAATRYKDYVSIARVSMIAGIFFSFMFFGIPFALVSLFYARKGFKQLRDEGRSMAGLIVTIVLASLELLAGLTLLILVIYAFAKVKR